VTSDNASAGSSDSHVDAPPSLGESAAAWWSAAQQALSDTTEIALLEARIVAIRLGLIAACAMAFGLALMSAWILLLVSAAVLAVEAGSDLPATVFVAALANIALVWPLAWLMRWLGRGVRFDTTMQQLGPNATSK